MKHERTKPPRGAAAAVAAALDDSDEESDVQYRCVTLVRLRDVILLQCIVLFRRVTPPPFKCAIA